MTYVSIENNCFTPFIKTLSIICFMFSMHMKEAILKILFIAIVTAAFVFITIYYFKFHYTKVDKFLLFLIIVCLTDRIAKPKFHKN